MYAVWLHRRAPRHRRRGYVACGAVAATAVTVLAGCTSTDGSATPARNTAAHSTVSQVLPLAKDGTIVFVNTPSASSVLAPGLFVIQTVQPNGTARTTIFSRHREIDFPPRWSPDGKRIVFSMNSAHSSSISLYIVNANGTGLRKVSTGRNDNEAPAWSPDGSEIAFASLTVSSPDRYIFVKSLKTGTVTRVTRGTVEDGDPAWSPDGRKIAFDRCGVRRGAICHLWVKNLATGQLRQVTSGPAFDEAPAWSPDGRRIAFASLRTGRWNIFTMWATGGGLVQLTNTKRGGLSYGPSWSPDGTWIAFEAERNGPRNIFAVRAAHGGGPKPITNIKLPRNAQYPDWGP